MVAALDIIACLLQKNVTNIKRDTADNGAELLYIAAARKHVRLAALMLHQGAATGYVDRAGQLSAFSSATPGSGVLHAALLHHITVFAQKLIKVPQLQQRNPRALGDASCSAASGADSSLDSGTCARALYCMQFCLRVNLMLSAAEHEDGPEAASEFVNYFKGVGDVLARDLHANDASAAQAAISRLLRGIDGVDGGIANGT